MDTTPLKHAIRRTQEEELAKALRIRESEVTLRPANVCPAASNT